MSVQRGTYFAFISIAARIWSLITEPVSISDMCTQLQREFEVDEEECRSDVIDVLAKLQAEGLVTVRSSG
jgi:hypothetical protein